MADDKKRSGAFYRKRKLQKLEEDVKQAKALSRFFVTPTRIKDVEIDDTNVDVNELTRTIASETVLQQLLAESKSAETVETETLKPSCSHHEEWQKGSSKGAKTPSKVVKDFLPEMSREIADLDIISDYEMLVVNQDIPKDQSHDNTTNPEVISNLQIYEVNNKKSEELLEQCGSNSSHENYEIEAFDAAATNNINKHYDPENTDCSEAISYEAYMQDIGTWPKYIPQSLRDLLISKGTSQLQNKDSCFPVCDSGRSLSKQWFDKPLLNGEKVNRTWMCFSPVKRSLFCFCCILFPQKKHPNSSFCNENGFSSWKKLNPRVSDHEKSPAHRSAFLEWKDLERAFNKGALIDDHLQSQIVKEAKTWNEILERIVATVQTLAQQNLALRGHRESIDNSNPGNFLALLKYLAKFDPVMRSHLNSVSDKPGCISYLSPEIQNEIIFLIGNRVRQNIIASCKKAKYFSIILDTTPDASHVEQMSQIIRYVHIEKNSVNIREAFIDFVPLDFKTAEKITEKIIEKFEQDGLNLHDCRGQSYDNQATMAGIHSGVQKRILDLNPFAVFVPCDNHSLNLVGVHAASINAGVVTFFGTIERLYTFFSCSTHRWSVLKQFVPITVKRHCDTRWSSKAEAVKAVATQLNGVVSCLEQLRDTDTETIDTRQDAGLIIGAIENFNFVTYLMFWSEILSSIDKVNKILQTVGISFHQALTQIQKLSDEIQGWRDDDLCEKVILDGERICEEWGINTVKRVRKKRMMPGETTPDTALDSRQEMRRSLVEVLDKLALEISNRFNNLNDLENRFGFLCEFEKYVKENNFKEKTTQIKEKCNMLAQKYPCDIDGEELFSDLKDIIILLKRALKKGDELDFTSKGLLEYICSMGGLEAYNSLATSLQIFLTLPVSVSSCERSFSKLKIIESYLRSSMSQERLSNLAIISIESDLASSLDYKDLIADFAAAKARKVNF